MPDWNIWNRFSDVFINAALLLFLLVFYVNGGAFLMLFISKPRLWLHYHYTLHFCNAFCCLMHTVILFALSPFFIVYHSSKLPIKRAFASCHACCKTYYYQWLAVLKTQYVIDSGVQFQYQWEADLTDAIRTFISTIFNMNWEHFTYSLLQFGL